MSMDIPKDHPRYLSLVARHLLEDGVKEGVTTMTGLVAHGRGEAFDYLLKEKTHEFARDSARIAAAMMLAAKKPVISVNGNTAVLVAKEMLELSALTSALIEINIFHDSQERRQAIAKRFQSLDLAKPIFGISPDAMIPGLSSARARVDSRGMFDADVVLVSLEDGDRTEALIKAGKTVIAIDLNPFSRTPQMASVAIVDNVQRAIPEICHQVRKLSGASRIDLEKIIKGYNHQQTLKLAESAIRQGA